MTVSASDDPWQAPSIVPLDLIVPYFGVDGRTIRFFRLYVPGLGSRSRILLNIRHDPIASKLSRFSTMCSIHVYFLYLFDCPVVKAENEICHSIYKFNAVNTPQQPSLPRVVVPFPFSRLSIISMEKSSARKDKKEATYNNAFEDEDFIICRKVDFQHGMSTLLYNAWKHRNSESHLYALYNYIQAIQSLTLLHTTLPTRVVAPWPQPLFGTLGAPKGVENYPSPNARLPGNYYPDHARIMIFGSKEQGPSYSLEARISIALDSSEAKVLNVVAPWNSEESQRAAERVAKFHVVQVCESSLAGLAHNPFWTSLYAFLLIGPYFSLFVWKTRPDPQRLELLPEVPSVPEHGPSRRKEALATKRREVIQQRIDRITETPLPEVVYYAEPMFTFRETRGQKWYEKVTLSPKYLHALSLPTSALSEELACQPSWFGVGDSNNFFENNRRRNVQQDMGAVDLREMVIEQAVKNELVAMNLSNSHQPDPTLAGPKPPDSSDSQQSRFSEAEPQVFDPNAGPHPMRTRASIRDDVEDAVENIAEGVLDLEQD